MPARPTLRALDPRLRGGRLDGVVAVVGGRQVEQAERPARAARAAHLDADDGEVQQRRDDRADDGRGRGRERVARPGRAGQRADDRADQVVRRGGLVAGVLDQRRERAVGERLAGRQADGHRDLDAVAHLHVVEALLQLDLLVEGRRRVVAGGEDGERLRRRLAGLDAVALARLLVDPDLRSEAVGLAGRDHLLVGVEKLQRGALLRADHVGLLDAPMGGHRRTGRRGEHGQPGHGDRGGSAKSQQGTPPYPSGRPCARAAD